MSRGGSARFRPGQSGNPNGRPRRAARVVSPFDVIFEKTLTVTQGGVSRELTTEEALQLQTYQLALKGRRSAQRDILKMIVKRERWLDARRRTPAPAGQRKIAYDGRTADEAMLLLGIAGHDTQDLPDTQPGQIRLKLEPWVTELCRKFARGRFSRADRALIQRNTRQHDQP